MPDLAELNLVINSSDVTKATAAETVLLDTSKKLEIQINVTANAFNNNNTVLKNHQSSVEKLSSSYAGLIKGALAFAGIAAAIAAVGVKAIEAAAQQEQLEIAFTTLTGSAEKAKNMLAQLQDFANHTPFQFQGLADASRMLLAFGFQAEQIPATIRSIADAAAASGRGTEGILSISNALGEVQSQGKITGNTLRMLAADGIPAAEMLADALGVSVPQALELVEKQAVSGSQGIQILLNGFNKLYGGATETLSNTTAGLFSTLEDVVQSTMKRIGTVLIQTLNIKALLGGAIHYTDVFGTFFGDTLSALTGVQVEGKKASEAAQELAKWLVIVGGSIVAATLIEGFLALTTAIEEAGGAMAILNLIMDANPFGLVAAGVGVLVGALLYLRDVTVTIGGQSVTVGDIVASTWSVVSATVLNGFKAIGSQAAALLSGLAVTVKTSIQYVSDTITSLFNYVTTSSSSVMGSVLSIVHSTVNILIGLLKDVIDTLTTLIERVGNFASSFSNLNFSSPTELFKSLGAVASSAAASLDPTTAFAEVKQKWATNLNEDFVGDVTGAVSLVAGKGKQIATAFYGAFQQGGITGLLGSITPSSISSVFSSIEAAAQSRAKARSDAANAPPAALAGGRGTAGLNALGGDSLSPAQEKLAQMNESLDQQIDLLKQGNEQARIGSELANAKKLIEQAITVLEFQNLPPAQAAVAAAKAQADALDQIRQKLETINYEKNLNQLTEMTDQLKVQASLIGADSLTSSKMGGLQKIGDSLGVSYDDLAQLASAGNNTADAMANIRAQTGLTADQVQGLTDKLKGYLAGLDALDQKQKLQQLSNDLGNDFGKPLDEIINKTATLKKAFKDLFDSILDTLQKQLIVKPFTDMMTGAISSMLGASSGTAPGGGVKPGAGGVGNLIGGAANSVFGSLLGGAGNLLGGVGKLFGFGNTPATNAGSFVPSTATAPSINLQSTPDITAPDPDVYAAKGQVFDRGMLQLFAQGGVVNSPTMFPMAGGRMGMMGEAGPEAVIPLSRGADGRLGVRGHGGVQGSGASEASGDTTNHNYNTTIQVSTPDVNSFRQSSQTITRRITDQLKRSQP